MKSLLLLLTATFLWAFTATAQHHDSTPAEPDYRKLGGVAFESSPIDNVFEQARVANRPVFVEIYSPSCPHCQELMPSFASKKVGDFYNQHFVCTKLVISDKTTVEFLEQKKLTIPELPFLLFFEPGGKLIHLSQTEKNEDAVIAVATTALNPAIRSESYPQHFANGVRTANFLLEYGLATIVSRNWTANKAVMEAYAELIRVDDAINVHKDFKEGKGLEEKTRNNALFLGVCDQFNGVISKQILKWFHALGTISGVDHKHLRVDTLTILNDEQYNAQLLTFLGKLDLGFKQIEIRDDDIFIVHAKYNATQVAVGQEFFNLDIYESAGTQKLFDIIGQIFYSLLFGGILVVDELDSKLHPLMTQAIIRLFNDPETNSNNAQLIFATHDTNLLTYGGFRRDQIYFTEKDQFGATCLYSLVEYKEEDGEKVRNDQSFEKAYIKGRYGAIPFIGDLSKFIPIWQEK